IDWLQYPPANPLSFSPAFAIIVKRINQFKQLVIIWIDIGKATNRKLNHVTLKHWFAGAIMPLRKLSGMHDAREINLLHFFTANLYLLFHNGVIHTYKE